MALYSQRDARWANQRLGTVNGATIGQYGCYTTSEAMMASDYGVNVNPSQLDDIFTDHAKSPYTLGGYVAGDLCWDGMMTKVYGSVFTGFNVENPGNNPFNVADLAQADRYGREAIIEIDFDHNPNDGIQTHFVRLFAYNRGDLIIDDPWYGTRDLFSKHYGTNPSQTIQKVIYYDAHSAAAPVAATPPPQIVEQPAATPVQATVSATPIQAADEQAANEAAAAQPIVTPVVNPVVDVTPVEELPTQYETTPEYMESYKAFSAPQHFIVNEDTTAVDMTGVGAPKQLTKDMRIRLAGTFTDGGRNYYRGDSGSWYGVGTDAVSPTGTNSGPVAVKVIPGRLLQQAEAAAQDVANKVTRVPGVKSLLARFLGWFGRNKSNRS